MFTLKEKTFIAPASNPCAVQCITVKASRRTIAIALYFSPTKKREMLTSIQNAGIQLYAIKQDHITLRIRQSQITKVSTALNKLKNTGVMHEALCRAACLSIQSHFDGFTDTYNELSDDEESDEETVRTTYSSSM